MSTIVKYVSDFLREEDGVTAMEYGLIAALILVAIATMVQTIGTNLNLTFSAVNAKL